MEAPIFKAKAEAVAYAAEQNTNSFNRQNGHSDESNVQYGAASKSAIGPWCHKCDKKGGRRFGNAPEWDFRALRCT